MKAFFITLAAMLLLSPGFSATAAPPKIVMEEFQIPAVDAGVMLYVRNKHPEKLKTVSAEKILLFVHGATYPSETAFDLPLNGLSWMDYVARGGYDVYLVDVRGYGKSTRPAEMDAPPDQNEPIARTEIAVKDVGAAVESNGAASRN
jgi:pimeloyl-ACP methyl ester carboxylesterase